MRIYLDNCSFNRPFDDQQHIRIRLESEAKLYLQGLIMAGSLELVWSYMLEMENNQNPFKEKRVAVERWTRFAAVDIDESQGIIARAKQLVAIGVKPKDALHVASAIEGKADYFVTTDDKLLKKLINTADIVAINPINLAGIIDERSY
ncbi:MAG: PIN domain protein [Gammaproteobacteria bacterium RIFOXYA12_FULL_61_12]|nr:MAG: PIN domain protein [Gammaproteobacteria bacterium RIFOXYD12_FULL_61_37]OGT93216.1 MAG: PIN domain protein [Gammaproteobacteria bacterium RIFOXYA12_FULL_61_12]